MASRQLRSCASINLELLSWQLERMATDWRALAMEQAELISGRLRELLSSGQGYMRSQFGVELGLRPELYPSWAVLLTAVVGVLVVLVM